jgi:hypothetical protein
MGASVGRRLRMHEAAAPDTQSVLKTQSAPGLQHDILGEHMEEELQPLINELINIVHTLDQHVAPADMTGKRLLHQAHQRLALVTAALERGRTMSP